MKKILLFYCLFLISLLGMAQPNPPTADNFLVVGTVKNVATNAPVANWPVRVKALNGINFNQTVFTNLLGQYYVEVKNGSLIGPNIYYQVSTLNCDSTLKADTVWNSQGTVDSKIVNFLVCQKPITSTCNAIFDFVKKSDGTYSAKPQLPQNTTYSYKWTVIVGNTIVKYLTGYDPVLPLVSGLNKVCLLVYGPNCKADFCKEINFVPPTTTVVCDAEFKFQDSLKAPATVKFFSKVEQTSDKGFKHFWYFGDASTSDLQNPEHTFLKPGKYSVCHKVINSAVNCEKTLCKIVTILPKDSITCKAYFENELIQTATTPYRYFFKNKSLGLTNTTKFVWTYGDGSKNDSTLNAEHTFPGPGTYNVCLIIKNSNCQDYFCKTIVVYGLPTKCDADFKWNVSSPLTPLKVNFNSIDNPLVLHKWSFTPNSKSVLANPQFTFPAPGKYKVCHWVYSLNGLCKDSVCKDVIVGVAPVTKCKASFVWTATSGNPLKINFKNESFGATKYSWTFGDGTTSQDANPSHIYQNSGIYKVCLLVKSDSCQSEICAPVYVQKDTSGFTIGGLVFAGANKADVAKVRLIIRNPITGKLMVFATTTVDSTGRYTFTNVPSGIYLIQAILLPTSKYFSNYIPTYFGGHFFWKFAQPVVVNANGDTYHISLIYSKFKWGKGKFGGGICNGPIPCRLDETILADAFAIITDLNDEPKTWTPSDEAGSFTVDNLDWGTYRLWLNIEGFDSEPVEFTLSEQTPDVNFNVLVTEEVVTLIKNVKSNINSIGVKVYPNPANDVIKVNFELLKSSNLSFEIMNLAGQVVFETNSNYNSGTQTATLQSSQIQSGVYFLNIKNLNDGSIISVSRIAISH